MSDIFVGRQPIYDRKLDVYAYELLFRSEQANSANIIDAEEATSDVILNTFLEIGLDNIVNKRLAFINLTRSFFVNRHTISLPKDRVVLELLEDIQADDEVISGVKRLSEQGYHIALDDFTYHESLRPLVNLATLVKLDVMTLGKDEVRDHVMALRKHPVKLVAEKVETQSDFDYCLELGFDYFQGYFFAQPKVIRGRRLPNNRVAILKLLSRLENPDITAKQVEELISRHVAFSDRILRYANCGNYRLSRKIESLQEAIVRRGLHNIKSWTKLLAVSQVDNKPNELVIIAAVRAKMAEALAKAEQCNSPDSFFTVGLFSALDALMDNTMEEILTQVPLADHIANALLRREGVHGEILNCVLAYERGEWQGVSRNTLTMSEIRECYLSALQWAENACDQLLAP